MDKPSGLTTMRHAEDVREFGARAKRYLPTTLQDLLPGLIAAHTGGLPGYVSQVMLVPEIQLGDLDLDLLTDLNDVLDVRRDRTLRPDRPIASGASNVRTRSVTQAPCTRPRSLTGSRHSGNGTNRPLRYASGSDIVASSLPSRSAHAPANRASASRSISIPSPGPSGIVNRPSASSRNGSVRSASMYGEGVRYSTYLATGSAAARCRSAASPTAVFQPWLTSCTPWS